MSTIPIFYRIFFLYIDPLICLLGVYTFFFDHPTYITNGTPHSLSSTIQDQNLTPLEKFLLSALGSYALCIFGVQILLLHQFHDVRIWRIVMFSILLTDLGLLYTVYTVDPSAFWAVRGWTGGDWSNNGILGLVIAIRSAFLLGIGGVQG